MIRLLDKSIDNDFIDNRNLESFFTLTLAMVLENHVEKDLLPNKIEYFHAIIKYPKKWKKDTDIFQFIPIDILHRLQRNEIYFLFDGSNEGWSPIKQHPFFELLHYNCAKYFVSPSRVIFPSINLIAKEVYDNWCLQNNIITKLKIFGFNGTESQVKPNFFKNLIQNYQDDELYEQIYRHCVNQCTQIYNGHYVLSLSRVLRTYRFISTFLLNKTRTITNPLMSHDKVSPKNSYDFYQAFNILRQHGVDTKEILDWVRTLPYVIDQENFDINWAQIDNYSQPYFLTLFNLVNETEVNNFQNTTLYYSEKTLRSIYCVQPLIIWGQQGTNQYLKNIGYETYEKYFDLSFDNESDNFTRITKLLREIERICRYLATLSQEDQIKWRFSHSEILMHNLKMLVEQHNNVNLFKNFLINEIYTN